MLFKKEEWRLLWPFYLGEFILASFMLAPIYWVIYFNEIGYSFTQISFLLAICFFTSLIFEVPTGAIADLVGRKISTILGMLATGIILIIVPFVPSYYWLIVIYIIWGITDTLRSGADEAWVVDLVKKKELVKDYYAKSSSIGNLGYILAPLIAGLVIRFLGLNWIWFIHGIAVFLFCLVLLNAKEKFVKRKINLFKAIKNSFKESKKGFKYSLKHPALFYILIGWIFLVMGGAITFNFWPPYLKEVGLPLDYIGYLISFASLAVVITPLFAKKIVRFFGDERKTLLVIYSLEVFLLLILAIKVHLLFVAVIFYLYYVGENTGMPIFGPFFQKFVPTKQRATISSIKEMMSSIGVIIATLFAGYLADTIGLQYLLVVAGVVAIPGIILFGLIKKKHL